MTVVNHEVTDAYNVTEQCWFTITVSPVNVPEATVTAPSFPNSISCEAAIAFAPEDATYSNDFVDACNVSGALAPSVISNFTKCYGTIEVSYSGTDQFNRPLSAGPFMITVEAAPLPTITPPALPNSISCAAAENYAAPTASYSNGLSGVCNLSGTSTGNVNYFFDECGGNLEVIYLATDACGRNLIPSVSIIEVEPAPAPTLTLPTLPTTLSCTEADTYYAPAAPYDNGLTGACHISGLLPVQIIKDVNATSGGTITVLYNGNDGCGNQLSAAPMVINVTPATPAILTLPFNPQTIQYWDAANYDHGNATYDNGENGVCKNSGEIAPTYQHFWNTCEGGYILVKYEGEDAAGNPLSADFIKVSVLPDTWAPIGTCVTIEETVSELKLIPSHVDLESYKNEIASNYSDYCGQVIITVVGDTGIPECELDGTFEKIYFMEVADECGNVADTCSIIFSGKCNPLYCTMTQDFYNNPDESFGSYTSLEMIDFLIDSGANPIVIGNGTCGITLDNAACIQTTLSGEGQSTHLPSNYNLNCGNAINNTLVTQLITTMLNVRYNEMLNGNGMDFGNYQLDAACLSLSYAITSTLPAPATINDLIDYTNQYIACQCNNSCSDYSNVMVSLTINLFELNSKFEDCQVAPPCVTSVINDEVISKVHVAWQETPFEDTTTETSDVDEIQSKSLQFKLYPNPANEFIHLEGLDFLGKNITLKIYNNLGVLVGENTFTRISQPILKVDLSQFSTGTYWLAIESERKRITKPFQVVK